MRRSSTLILAVALGLAACAGPLTSASPIPSGVQGSPVPTDSAPPPSEPSATSSPTDAPAALAWEALQVDGPAAREDHTWTLADDGVAYLFGGRDGETVFADTWAFNVESLTWTELAPPRSPQPRFGHEAVWVDGVGVVIFAGQGGPSTFFNDLWAYDPATNAWTQLPASGAIPTPRYGSCLAVGPDGRLWASHGFTQEGTRFSDTRAYDISAQTWTDETPSQGQRPVERCLHGCWWTDDGTLTLYAGQTTGLTALDDLWSLDAGRWSRVDAELPAGRNLYGRARHDGGMLIFGGQAVDGSYLADAFLLADDASVEVLAPSGEAPPGRAGAELIVDPSNSRAFLFGGRTADSALGDTWVLSGL
ncbi:MAG: kelch repeat-containing protein [Candidatus Limnocylindria bacterium]